MSGGDEVDWALLRTMRAGFLEAGEGAAMKTALADYWTSEAHLAAYDKTFAERIRWKWNAVLEELAERGIEPPRDAVIHDFGTGTGIAARAVLAAFPALAAGGVKLADRSARALQFAASRLRAEAPAARVETWDPATPSLPHGALLIASHVVTELDAAGLAQLVRLAASATMTIWVEPGTSPASRALIDAREALRATRHVLAPCGHEGPCGLTAPENARHWCHHFARPPSEASQSALWARFRKELGIDLRSLPVSFLVLAAARSGAEAPGPRVIGRARASKGHARALLCDACGVVERDIQKRAAKEGARSVWKALEDSAFTTFVPDPILA